MPRFLLLALLFLCASHYSRSQDLVYTKNAFTGPEILLTSTNQIVYICLASNATTYHSSATCTAMGHSRAGIAYTDENTAAYTYGRRACSHCWSNVKEDPKEDLAGNGKTRINLFQRIGVWRAGRSQVNKP
ncbi:MAG TPA: hypothetical protein VIM79_13635 [Niastella sp.]